jgi:peptide/nickel transport system permease protein
MTAYGRAPLVQAPGAPQRRAGGHLATGAIRVVRAPVVAVVVRRLLFAVPLLLAVSGLSFVLVSLEPGDAAQEILGLQATPAQVVQLRHQMGLDQAVWVQWWHWLTHAMHGDLGASLFTQQPVTQALDQRLPVTLSLIGGSLLVILVVGVGLGLFSAARGGVAGRVVDALSLVGFALPSFWIGAVLIAMLAVRWRVFPATGYVPLAQSPGLWARSLVLPVAALGLSGLTATAKQTREAMLDALGSEYVRMARANGIPRRAILFRHALKNASTRVVTVLGVQAITLLGGTVLVETVFALPGLGGLAVDSSFRHDLPMIQGIAVYFTVIVVVVNLLIDVAYTWLNPRVAAP